MGNYDHKFFEADELIKDGKIAEAKTVLEDIIEEQPDYGRAHNHLGWIFETKLKEYAKAEEHYRSAMVFSPEYPAAYINYAYLLSTIGKFTELENHLNKCLSIQGVSKSTIHNEFGLMYEVQCDMESAISSYKKAIINSVDDKTIETYQANIERCKKKIELLK